MWNARTRAGNDPGNADVRRLRIHQGVIALLAAAAAVTSFWIGATVLEGIPHVADEVDYLFQARTFASGRLWASPPPMPELFQQPGLVLTPDRWCSKYHPGWPALLAIGVLLHLPGIVNPVALAIAVIGVGRLGRRLFDARTGLVAAAALAISPFALLMAAGTMAHTAALAASVWCLERLAAGADEGGARRFLAAGAVGGLAFLVRPMTAVALLLPAVLWALWRRWRERDAGRSLSALAFGAAPALAAFLLYNAVVYGGPLTTGYAVWDPSERFNGDQGTYLHPWLLASRHLPRYLRDLGRSLWGWPWPDLLVFAPLLVPRPGRRRDFLLAACAASLVGVHAFYYFYDVVYSGPRFAFEALGPLAVLAARALIASADAILTLAQGRGRSAARAAPAAVALVAAVLIAFPLGVRLPAQLRYHAQAYHGQTAAPLREAVQAGVGENALIFVTSPQGGFVYGTYFTRNALDPLLGERVFARALSPLRDEAIREIPRREVWRLRVDLEPLPGPNDYPDAWKVRAVDWKRVDAATR